MGLESGEEVGVGAILAVGGGFGGHFEVGHEGWVVGPEKRGVVEIAVFGDILGVASKFFVA